MNETTRRIYMHSSDERYLYDFLADTYGGNIIDDSDYGETDEEQAYEDVVGIADEDGR
jgi:hypothetical protein